MCHTTPTKMIEFNLCLVCFGNKHAINNFNQKTIIITSAVLEQHFGTIWHHYTPGSDWNYYLTIFLCMFKTYVIIIEQQLVISYTQLFLVQIKNIIIDKKTKFLI